MSQTMVCVLRNLSGSFEYVPVSEVPFLEPGERVFVGQFNSQTEKHGPYGSHSRTVCLPAGVISEGTIPAGALHNGKLVEGAAVMQCVLREVEPSDTQYRPVNDVDARTLHRGERLFTGVFRTVTENHGPSGSHRLLVALPYGAVNESRYGIA